MVKKIFFLLILTSLVASCRNQKRTSDPSNKEEAGEQIHAKQNTLTGSEKSDGWVLLFDGSSINGWHLYNKPGTKPIWEAVDGELACDPLNGTGDHGDLVSDMEFENYDFTFEWKITESGNSGVFINVVEDPAFQQAWYTGPEYQLLDSQNKDFEIEEKRSGCLYGFSAQITETATKPAGQWNTARIKQANGKAEFYLNGNLTARVDFNSDEWKELVASSGFKDFPKFGVATKGHIVLQEWTSPVWFRNLKIKEL